MLYLVGCEVLADGRKIVECVNSTEKSVEEVKSFIEKYPNYEYKDESAMLLRNYIKREVDGLRNTPGHDEWNANFVRDMVNGETGEIYFIGRIDVIAAEFINDKLILVSDNGDELIFKEVNNNESKR